MRRNLAEQGLISDAVCLQNSKHILHECSVEYPDVGLTICRHHLHKHGLPLRQLHVYSCSYTEYLQLCGCFGVSDAWLCRLFWAWLTSPQLLHKNGKTKQDLQDMSVIFGKCGNRRELYMN